MRALKSPVFTSKLGSSASGTSFPMASSFTSGGFSPGDPPRDGPNITQINASVVTVANNLHLFALVIGVDNYATKPLKGAVADAEAMVNYLKNRLGVPDHQIRLLRNEEATKSSILEGLQALETNPAISKDDPILIFFAGHEATAEAPEGWPSTDSTIQLLVPHDCDGGTRGGKISGLPDRTLAVLLERIAEAKGTNITVILDCCHSGSGTRTLTESVRGLGQPITIHADLDRDIWSSSNRGAFIPTVHLRKNLRSHVLLAACGANELAREVLGRGIFTKALLKKLEDVGEGRITYTQLIRQISGLDEGKQNPQCEGRNRWRICFDARASSHQPMMYRVHKNNSIYTMEAGSIHGVTSGAYFAVYRDPNTALTDIPLGFLTASKPNGSSTVMALPRGYSSFEISERAFALKMQPGQEYLRVYVNGEDFQEALMPFFKEKSLEIGITTLKTEAGANLGLAFEGGNIVFNILDELVSTYGLTRIPFYLPFSLQDPSFDDLDRILRSAAHYHWHLHRTRTLPPLLNAIKVEFTKLIDDGRQEGEFQWGLRSDGINLIQGRTADFVVNPNTIYGIKITNNSDRSLYPSVFFFGNSDLSIEPYYQPGVSKGRVDPPLPPGGVVTIGYGPAGGDPISFDLDAGQDIDVGFLKIFLSTAQADLSDMEQPSPFRPGTRYPTRRPPRPNLVWHTEIFHIVQRRVPENALTDCILNANPTASLDEPPPVCALGTKDPTSNPSQDEADDSDSALQARSASQTATSLIYSAFGTLAHLVFGRQ